MLVCLFVDDVQVEPLSITLLAGDERHHQAVHDKYLVDVASQLQAAEPTPWSIPMQNGSVLSCNYSRAEAATLKLEVIAARRLRHAEVLCKDPYCVVEVLGCPEPQRFQSPVDEGAGSHPVWNYALTLNVLRSYQLRVSSWASPHALGRQRSCRCCSHRCLDACLPSLLYRCLCTTRMC